MTRIPADLCDRHFKLRKAIDKSKWHEVDNKSAIDHANVFERLREFEADTLFNSPRKKARQNLTEMAHGRALKAQVNAITAELARLRREVKASKATEIQGVDEIVEYYGIDDELNQLRQLTSLVFGQCQFSITAGASDHDEEPYLLLTVEVESNADPNATVDQQIRWTHDAMDILGVNSHAVRMLVQFK